MNRVVRSFLIVIALLNLTFFFRWWKKDDLCIIEEIEGKLRLVPSPIIC